MKKFPHIIILFIIICIIPSRVYGEQQVESNPRQGPERPLSSYNIFDDKMLMNGYAQKYSDTSKEILLAMIKDETLTSHKTAAAIRVFREKFSEEVVSREKKYIEKLLLRRLGLGNSPLGQMEKILLEKILLGRFTPTLSPFIQIETMHTLCHMNRYKYFKTMVPAIIEKLEHYNSTINEMAFDALEKIVIKSNQKRPREARIVFNALRKKLFLSRHQLEKVITPSQKLKHKLELLRWSVKILGSQELKRLPKEVMSLL